MPRVYTVGFEQQDWLTADGDIDIFELDAATDKPIAVKGCVIKVTSELQEGQEEWLRLKWIRGHATSGSGAPTTITPRPLSPNDAAAGFTCEILNDTIASAGTPVDVDPGDAFNVRNGYEMFLAPEDWIWTSGADLLVLRGMAAPTDDVKISAKAWIVEVP
jgi:hypothetical protein